MLIDENGYSVGTVSGGYLEADVLERAKKVLETGEATVITYDTTKDENSVFGLNMGCRGIVRILLEEVSSENRLFDFLKNAFGERESFTMATLITSNSEDLKIGRRLFLRDSTIMFTAVKPHVPVKLIEALHNFSREKTANLAAFDFGEVFFENIVPPLNLLLFGAGYDALPLIGFAKEIGWRVTDDRPPRRVCECQGADVPKADEIIVSSSSENLPDGIYCNDENSVAVIMTHNYDRDREILRRLMNSKCQYVGVLGPKPRTEKLLAEIGEKFDKAQLAKLYAPVGLDIGADTPETIALSIIAEIKRRFSQHATEDFCANGAARFTNGR